MSSATELARSCVNTALQEAKVAQFSEDAIARALISEAIAIYKKSRSSEDIANEFVFLAENLSEDDDYTFMRP